MSKEYDKVSSALAYAKEKGEHIIFLSLDDASELMAKLYVDAGRIKLFEEGYKGGCYACEPVGEKNVKLAERVAALEAKWVQALGWAYADCCTTLDKGGDPRQTDMADILRRATIDLEEKGNE